MKREYIPILLIRVHCGVLTAVHRHLQEYSRLAKSETDSVREGYDAHNIKIMKIEDNGDATFLVSGYMNRGEHEGQVGVSLCRYSYSDNDVTERLFIPMAIPYNILTQNVGGVSYVSNDKFYILIDETLYSVDLVSKEVMTEITGLKENSYAVSEPGDAIAYSVSGDLCNTDTIRVLNMSNHYSTS